MTPAMMHPTDDDSLDYLPTYPVFVDQKIDGYRLRALVGVDGDGGTVVFQSRGGHDFPALAHLKAPLLAAAVSFARAEGTAHAAYILDAEVSCGSLAATAAVRGARPADQARLVVFDLVDGASHDPRPLSDRRQRLRQFLSALPSSAIPRITRVKSWRAEDPLQVDRVYQSLIAAGAEGVVIKTASSLYRGGRSTQWRKRKPVLTADFPVVGLVEGTGQWAGTLGGIVVACDGGEMVIGGGFDAAERDRLWNLGNRLIGRVIEVSYLSKTQAGFLTGAAFLRVRDDLATGAGTVDTPTKEDHEMTTTAALTINDVTTDGDDAPRVLDVRLGERLGMARPTNIRKMIEDNRDELERYGSLHAVRAMITAGNGAQRATTEYYLNEQQALLLCMFSRTAAAADVRQEVIAVFMAYRRGEPKAARAGQARARAAVSVEIGSGGRLSKGEVNAYTGYLKMMRDIFGEAVAAQVYQATPLAGLASVTVKGDDGAGDVQPPLPAEVDGWACLAYLCAASVPRRPLDSIGGLLVQARKTARLREQLGAMGLFVDPTNLGGFVAVACAHPQLQNLFAMSDWAPAWDEALLTLPGARKAQDLILFPDRKRRAVLVPWACVADVCCGGR